MRPLMSANEKIFPAPDILNEVEYGKFVLTNLAAKRAKQIKEGAPPLVRIETNHPLSIALEEIAKGKIKPILGSDAQAAELDEDYSALDELGLDDVGLLLPSVEELEDEEDGEMLDFGSLAGEEEEEDDEEVEAEEAGGDTLAKLLGDEEVEDEEEAEPTDDDASLATEETGDISLDDLQEEEEAGSGDDENS